MSEWQPIETAPKDGTSILLCAATDAAGEPLVPEIFEFFCQVAQWWGRSDAGDWVVCCGDLDDLLLHFDPTHWQHIPESPVLREGFL